MKISLYIHIPFCVKKCLYCDFLSGPYDTKVRSSYVEALCNEIATKAAGYIEYEVISIFFGGGTPSLLTVEQLECIMHAIYSNYNICEDCEVTMEVNPGTVEGQINNDDATYSVVNKLAGFKHAGINRLSIGLQSAREEELKLLGRIHNLEDFERTWNLAELAGFENLNVDLISGLPGQTIEDFEHSLKYVLNLKNRPTHISVYSLIIEEGTPFFDKYADLNDETIEENDRAIYKITNGILEQNGYHRYEISNYALDGYECRHNKVYWQRGNYLSFGIGASSMVDNARWSNTPSIDKYLADSGLSEDVEYHMLSIKEQMEEFMFLGLRMMKGISVSQFEEYFGTSLPEQYEKVIAKYTELGYMKVANSCDIVMLTEEGIDISNRILADFLFDE